MLTHPQRVALVRAISPDRLGTYRFMSQQTGINELSLYLWDRDVAAAVIADIAILEIALRNAMNDALAERAGRPDWYSCDMGFDNRSLQTIARAWSDLPSARRTPGRIVSQLMFGFWRNLLEAGGDAGFGPLRRPVSYEDLWRSSLHGAFPGGRIMAKAENRQFTRNWTLRVVREVHALRNRAAHHEPLLTGIPIPGEDRRVSTEQGLAACLTLARVLDRDLAGWFEDNSRIAEVLASKPS